MLRKLLLGLLAVVLLLALTGAGLALYRLRDRQPGYSLNLNVKPAAMAKPLRVGFAAVDITPALPDRWVDKNGDAAYNPDEGDQFQDGNGNESFDAYWMAGFGQRRAANGVHDPIWARAVVLDDGQSRVAFVSLDLMGFLHRNVVNVRKALPKNLGVTYAVISSTHNHEGPDMVGMWGEGFLSSGVNDTYQQQVEANVVKAISEAVARLQPARLRFAQDLTGADALVEDTRKPIVKDAGLYVMQALATDKDSTLGTLVVWGNHPEVLWDRNLLLTSDFPHYVRQTLEAELGGTTVYATGAIGGLMTTSPDLAVTDSGATFREPNFAKAEVVGRQVAKLAIAALKTARDVAADSTGLRLVASTMDLPLDNTLFKLGIALGVLNGGYSRWGHLRSEVAALRIGPADMLFVPGEIYPEFVNGGIETPPGADFPDAPFTLKPLRSIMRGRYKFVVGLANDEIGYIIPKSEWDTKPPYLYGAKEELYGEINSLGPETGPLLYQRLHHLLKLL